MRTSRGILRSPSANAIAKERDLSPSGISLPRTWQLNEESRWTHPTLCGVPPLSPVTEGLLVWLTTVLWPGELSGYP
jgi:hypothetical protein